MSNQKITISLSAFAKNLSAVVGKSSLYFPRDDGEGPQIGPNIRQIVLQGMKPFQFSALNPQPIPPRALIVQSITQALVERIDQLQEMGQMLPEESSAKVQAHTSRLLAEFDDWCGTGQLSRWIDERIAEWLRHNPLHPQPTPGDPEPISPADLWVVGAVLLSAEEVHPQFASVAQNLLEIAQ